MAVLYSRRSQGYKRSRFLFQAGAGHLELRLFAEITGLESGNYGLIASVMNKCLTVAAKSAHEAFMFLFDILCPLQAAESESEKSPKISKLKFRY